ncbi:MAG: uridine kinase [Polyangiales bacterium]
MSSLVADDGRTHLVSPLMKQSLVDRRVTASTATERELAVLPEAFLVSIGGQSIFDRGKSAVLPLVDALAAARPHYKMVVGVGGGTRVRHTMAIAMDLGINTGGIAQLVGAMEEANAVFLNVLLAKHGSIVMQREHFWELPLYLHAGMLPIVISVPPYHFWEPPPKAGALPTHGSDFGLFMYAEVLGMKRVIFVKDEDGLYSADPKQDKNARFIPRITLAELAKEMPAQSPIDKVLFEVWQDARHIEQIQIVNGLKPEMLTRALAGEPVGTVIEKEKG